MYSDRLTLILAYFYIQGCGNSIIVNGKIETGTVSDITFSVYDKFTDPTNKRLIKFNTLTDLSARIEEIGTTTIFKAECDANMKVYELKSFNVVTSNGVFAYVQNTSGGWKCNSDIIAQDQINMLNARYQPTYDRTEVLYNNLITREFIKSQEQYVKCGYIRKWFGEIVDELTSLYKQYNTSYKNTL